MSETTPTLPAFDLWDGYATALDVYEPCWLYAGRLTNLDTGESQRFTYLSTSVKPQDGTFERMTDYLGGALPLGEPQTIPDAEMMFGSAEFTVYELLDVAA